MGVPPSGVSPCKAGWTPVCEDVHSRGFECSATPPPADPKLLNCEKPTQLCAHLKGTISGLASVRPLSKRQEKSTCTTSPLEQSTCGAEGNPREGVGGSGLSAACGACRADPLAPPPLAANQHRSYPPAPSGTLHPSAHQDVLSMPVAQAHNVAHHAPHRCGAGVGQPRVEPSGGFPPLAQEPGGMRQVQTKSGLN